MPSLEAELRHLLHRRIDTAESENSGPVLAARLGDWRPFADWQWGGILLRDDWQEWFLDHALDPTIRELYAKGNTGCGKNTALAIAVCTYFYVWPDAKVVLTRDTYENAVAVTFAEVSYWWRKMHHPHPTARLLKEGIWDSDDHFVRVANPVNPEGFHGVHSTGGHTLFAFDEATAGNLEKRDKDGGNRWQSAETQAQKLIAIANPRTRHGHFRRAFGDDNPDETRVVTTRAGRTALQTIGGQDCMNVKQKRLRFAVGPVGGIEIDGHVYEHGEAIPPDHFELVRPIIPGQTCYDEWKALAEHPEPFQRDVFAFAKFPQEDPEKQLILGSWLRAWGERWTAWDRLHRMALKRRDRGKGGLQAVRKLMPVEGLGLDVAASHGGDATQLAMGGHYGLRGIWGCQFADTQRTVRWVLDTVERETGVDLRHGTIPICVDFGGGYGNAVGDPLKAMGCRVIPVHGNATPDNPKRYANKRAELYAEYAARVDPDGEFADSPYAFPPDVEAIEELTAPQRIWKQDDGAKMALTPKRRAGSSENFDGETIEEMLGRSPDKADAIVLMHEAVRNHQGIDLAAWLDAGAF